MSESGKSKEQLKLNQHSLFSDFIVASQERWRQAKGFGLTEFSQAYDLPDTLGRLSYSKIIDNLPAYVPAIVVEKLRWKPEPIVAVSIVQDKRVAGGAKVGYPVRFFYEESIPVEDQTALSVGMNVLNEIATNVLTLDTMKKMGLRMMIFRLAQNANLRLGGLGKTIRKLESKGRNEYEEFTQALVLAMLTGDTSDVDRKCVVYGHANLNSLAIEIGKLPVQKNPLSGMVAALEQNELVNRVTTGFSALGQYDLNFPGVITIHLATSLPAVVTGPVIGPLLIDTVTTSFPQNLTHYAILGALLLQGFSPATIPSTIIHETVHYLSQEENHFGLYPMEYPDWEERK